jgi:sortase A
MSRENSSPRALAWIERALYAAAVLLLGGWSAVTVETRVYGYLQERRLARMIEAHEAAPAPLPPAQRRFVPAQPATAGPGATPAPEASSSPAPSPRPEAELVGRIEIPRLNLRAIIEEGIDSRTLRRAVGHLPGTPLPGEDGNVVLAGHRDTFFRVLKDVRADDIVRITTPLGRFEYVVEATAVVEPSRTDVLDATAEPSVTLVTCYPFYLVGEAPDRFVVRARLLATAD